MAYTGDDLIKWAKDFFPLLRFSKSANGSNEPFYPFDADAWITHFAAANVKERGTAMYQWNAPSLTEPADNWIAQPPVIAPGNIALNATPPNGIGDPRFQNRPPADPRRPTGASSEGDWYLDVGGWDDPAVKRTGQLGYTWQTINAFYSSLGLPASSPPVEPSPDDPVVPAATRFNPDARGLHAYAEFAPLGDVLSQLLDVTLPPDLDALNKGRTVIQGAADQLADMVSMTYYLLYPSGLPPGGKLMEGDWQALSMFFTDLGMSNLDLAFASYSQGYAGGRFPVPFASCKAAANLERNGLRPVAYVAWGSHANYFTPLTSEQTVDSGVSGGEIAGYAIAGTLALIGAICIGAGLAASPIGWVAVIVGIVLIIIAALIALFTYLCSDHDTPEPPPFDNTRDGDNHGGDGASAGGDAVGSTAPGDAPPSPGSPATGGSVPFLVRPISADPTIVDSRCAQPSWWSYAGRWGVCVRDSEAARPAEPGSPTSWSNGTWRRMPSGYTLTHRNVEALVDMLHGEIDSKTKTSTTNRG